MNHTSESRPVSWFRQEHEAQSLILRPPYQRKPVWTPKERCALIESILINVPIPEVYIHVTVNDEGEDSYGVIDGQQRIRTVLQYLGKDTSEGEPEQNGFPLDKLKNKESPFLGMRYADLPVDNRRSLVQYSFCVRFIRDATEEQVRDAFKRINTYSLPLRSQELRHATYEGPFMKLSEQLAEDKYWVSSAIVSTAQVRRMTDIEMMSDLLIGVMHGPQDGGRASIDKYYDAYEMPAEEFPEQRSTESVFKETRRLVAEILPGITDTRWCNRGDFYSLFVSIAHFVGNRRRVRNKAKLRKSLESFGAEISAAIKNEDLDGKGPAASYARAIVKGVNSKARRIDRHKILLSIMEDNFVSEA